MKILRCILWSSIVCGAFAAGCVAPATEPVQSEPVEASTGVLEQDLGATTQAQERLVTYYAEPELINVVGSCFGPYTCFGPKGTVCEGRKTAFYTIEWFNCGIDP